MDAKSSESMSNDNSTDEVKSDPVSMERRVEEVMAEDKDYAERLQIIDREFVSFYEYCRDAGFSHEEMEIICSPLQTALRHGFYLRMLKIGLAILALVVFSYQLLQINTVSLYTTAIARILMIKILPVWNWKHAFYDNCIIQNPLYQEYRPMVTEDDCTSCETVERVDHVRDASYDFLLGNYLMRDAPVVITDALDSWPALNDQHFSSENITQLYTQDERLIETVPCILVSNLRTGSLDLMAFLKRIINPNVERWFVHWQNCDINAVKALRKFYQRPYFLSNTIAPAHFNWVFMSSGYASSIFKKIDLDTGLIMLAQLKGSTVYRLSPLNPCNSSCVELLGDLLPGEMLIFTNYLWSFEYYPGSDSENIAILTETVWDDKIAPV